MGTATNSPPVMPQKKTLSLKRIGWLYQIFRDRHFYHGLVRTEHAVPVFQSHCIFASLHTPRRPTPTLDR